MVSQSSMKVLSVKHSSYFAAKLQRLCNLKAINYVMVFYVTGALLSLCWSALNAVDGAFLLPVSHFHWLVFIFREGQGCGLN
jgi:hypothetical protein